MAFLCLPAAGLLGCQEATFIGTVRGSPSFHPFAERVRVCPNPGRAGELRQYLLEKEGQQEDLFRAISCREEENRFLQFLASGDEQAGPESSDRDLMRAMQRLRRTLQQFRSSLEIEKKEKELEARVKYLQDRVQAIQESIIQDVGRIEALEDERDRLQGVITRQEADLEDMRKRAAGGERVEIKGEVRTEGAPVDRAVVRIEVEKDYVRECVTRDDGSWSMTDFPAKQGGEAVIEVRDLSASSRFKPCLKRFPAFDAKKPVPTLSVESRRGGIFILFDLSKGLERTQRLLEVKNALVEMTKECLKNPSWDAVGFGFTMRGEASSLDTLIPFQTHSSGETAELEKATGRILFQVPLGGTMNLRGPSVMDLVDAISTSPDFNPALGCRLFIVMPGQPAGLAAGDGEYEWTARTLRNRRIRPYIFQIGMQGVDDLDQGIENLCRLAGGAYEYFAVNAAKTAEKELQKAILSKNWHRP